MLDLNLMVGWLNFVEECRLLGILDEDCWRKVNHLSKKQGNC